MKILQLFLVTLVLVVAGCRTPDGADNDSETRVVAGVTVSGAHTYWTESKVIALKAAVAAVDHTYPILSIKFIDSTTAEVTTGVVRGPLDGSGREYRFKLKNGKWSADTSSTLIWVS
jgi:hypothetical protein